MCKIKTSEGPEYANGTSNHARLETCGECLEVGLLKELYSNTKGDKKREDKLLS